MQTKSVCVALLFVGLAIFAAHDHPATAGENRRSIQRRVCLPVCAAIRTTPQSPAILSTASPVPVDDAELRAKLMERRDTLKELLQILMTHYLQGTGTPFSVFQAQIELLEAELSLAKTHAERIVLYEKSLAARTEVEKLTQERRELGVGGAADHLRAKADRIKAEIDLHNARKMK